MPIFEVLTAKYLVSSVLSVTVTPIVEIEGGTYRREFRVTTPEGLFTFAVEADAPDAITFTMPDVLF